VGYLKEESTDNRFNSFDSPSNLNIELDEINKDIYNPTSNIDSVSAFEIITEAMVGKVEDIFGKNSLLSILYQVGAGPGEVISQRIKLKNGKEEFDILPGFKLLLKELKGYYSIQIKEYIVSHDQIRIIIENHCFLRSPIKNRPNLHFGKKFCRVNKGYFEVALKKLLGNKVKKVEIKFLENCDEKDLCLEEIVFSL